MREPNCQRTKSCHNCGLPNWAISRPGTVRLRLKAEGLYRQRERRLTVRRKGGRPGTHKNIAARMRAYRARQRQRQGGPNANTPATGPTCVAEFGSDETEGNAH